MAFSKYYVPLSICIHIHTVLCQWGVLLSWLWVCAQGLLFAAAQVREDRETWPQLRLNHGLMLEWASVKWRNFSGLACCSCPERANLSINQVEWISQWKWTAHAHVCRSCVLEAGTANHIKSMRNTAHLLYIYIATHYTLWLQFFQNAWEFHTYVHAHYLLYILLHISYTLWLYVFLRNKYFELKNSWGADGAPQTQTTC